VSSAALAASSAAADVSNGALAVSCSASSAVLAAASAAVARSENNIWEARDAGRDWLSDEETDDYPVPVRGTLDESDQQIAAE
jgi:hypothetical protein